MSRISVSQTPELATALILRALRRRWSETGRPVYPLAVMRPLTGRFPTFCLPGHSAENLLPWPRFAIRWGAALDFSIEILKISASGADFMFVAWLAGLGGKHGSGRTSGRN